MSGIKRWLTGTTKAETPKAGTTKARTEAAASTDEPMTPERMQELYPDCVAELKKQWEAEQAAGDAEGEGDAAPPIPETDDGASTATPTEASVATGGAASVSDREDPMADSKKTETAVIEQTGTASVAASIEELQAKFPNDPAFVLDCLKGKLGMAQAMEARNAQLEARVKDLEARATAAAADRAKLGAAGTGTPAIGGAPVAGAEKAATGGRSERVAKVQRGEHAYTAKVAEVMIEKGISRAEATDIVNKEHPELRQDYVARKG